jgi:hypothetical protein
MGPKICSKRFDSSRRRKKSLAKRLTCKAVFLGGHAQHRVGMEKERLSPG